MECENETTEVEEPLSETTQEGIKLLHESVDSIRKFKESIDKLYDFIIQLEQAEETEPNDNQNKKEVEDEL